ncbi:MAG: recombinase family protein [Peptoniphilaceae bacterium]
MTKFKTAIYLRLSRDDGQEEKSESNSITNQRNILKDFVKNRLDMTIVKEFIDDGYSGATFARPAFMDMMSAVDEGTINCIIVKDFSRFGRDYIESGNYMQKIFPDKGVRFIAVNDNYDSFNADTAETHLVLPIKNFVNDSYCRDISTKVKSSQQVKRKNGEFIGAFATFGYRKNPKNKNKLIIDEKAADVVKLIYHSKLEGYSNQAIANRLNQLGFLSPMAYKKENGSNYKTGFSNYMDGKWSAKAIGRILKNRIYIGVLEQGKRVKINYKIDKSIEVSQNDWIIVKDAHEPIISKELFNRVQKMSKRDLYLSEEGKNPKIFSGMLYCMDCGSSLLRRINRYKGKETIFYICSEYNKTKNCTRHSVKEEELKKVLTDILNHYYSNLTNLYSEIHNYPLMDIKDMNLAKYDDKLLNLEKEAKKYRMLKASLYDDLQDGVIDEQEFARFRSTYTIKLKNTEKAIKEQEELLARVILEIKESNEKLSNLKAFKEIKELTRKILVTAIDKIYVGEDKQLEIVFHGEDVFKYLENYVASLDKVDTKEAI